MHTLHCNSKQASLQIQYIIFFFLDFLIKLYSNPQFGL